MPSADAGVGSLVGTVRRLQVQRSRLKPGPRGQRAYDPSPLLRVDAVQVGPRGLTAPDGSLDVHHADHPDSRNVQLCNGLSVLPQAHYELLRALFGPHVVDGSAGESLLLETDGPLEEADLDGTLLLDTVGPDGAPGAPLELTDGQAAPPCIEFSRWVLGRGAGSPVDDEVQEAMALLQDGRRGFYLTVTGTGRVVAGARLRRA